MSTKLKITIIFLCSILLSVFLIKVGGNLYSIFFNTSCSGGLFIMADFNKGCWLEGFLFLYSVLLPFFLFLFLKTKVAWLCYFFGILIFLLFFITVGYYEGIAINIVMLIIAWLLAQGILLVYKRLKKT